MDSLINSEFLPKHVKVRFPVGALSGISDLQTLLSSMQPELKSSEYVFVTLPEVQFLDDALLLFREDEGVTHIFTKDFADEQNLSYEAVWRLITLTVHSSLNAVGFLAAITKELAAAGISVNAISAFYHDHLFVPSERADEALAIMRTLAT